MQIPKMIVFDLDDTLAPSKSELPQEMANLLTQLLRQTAVAVISGGDIRQFKTQLLAPLTQALGSKQRLLRNLHLMPTCGTRYERYADGSWQTLYNETLTEGEKRRAIRSLQECARELQLWESATWGDIIEDRGSQITFSALGQAAPSEAKAAWDPTGAKKNALAVAVQKQLPELAVRSGGSTSVDITRAGIDKAYGIKKLTEHNWITPQQMLFIGDRLDPAGNDYPVKALDTVPCVAVKNWRECANLLHEMLTAIGD
ncbi:HAD-IIB family hydrolase [Canibacter sp. lx-72]|uniref:HAD-IIB family hydrolase n=1 Tax=Canibacter zhuwentaonis TaxID=2837491 RepID=UPI001BDBB32B|nr:HAD-IIB family hydrolase [Canibacter zhuwentaonis]MBT1018432.1 HAD-IIB family hydrolase [Canibacter zhuwentaonis]